MSKLAIFAGALGACLVSSCSAPAPTCDILPDLDQGACASVHALLLPTALPPARGNAKGDDDGAAHLGFVMFYDARLSGNEMIRCATCHPPERHFQDGLPTAAKGLAPLTRNTPTSLNAARFSWLFWDGRVDSVWSQALVPLENPKEMGFSRLALAHRVKQSYASSYEAVFGPLPPLDDASRFPASGAPGDPAFDGMTDADKDTINRVFANVGKAFEAYERKLAAGRSSLDRFLAGDAAALTAAEQRGLVVFARAGCISCHSGPMLSDEAFHDLGLPTPDGAAPDRGRADGLEKLLASPFNSQGPYWDGARPAPPPQPTAADVGAFRTPSLRNIALTAPYGHDGRFATLRDITDFLIRGGGRGDPHVVGTVDAMLTPRSLTAAEEDDLVSFLAALNGDYPLPPWNNWPDR